MAYAAAPLAGLLGAIATHACSEDRQAHTTRRRLVKVSRRFLSVFAAKISERQVIV
jgi:hypothetical protein